MRSHEVHMTVDEKIIQAGWSQRRTGTPVDGCWMPELQRWGHPRPGWGHYTPDGKPIHRMSIIVADPEQPGPRYRAPPRVLPQTRVGGSFRTKAEE